MSLGNVIIDYSVHDAVKAGFNKIVFVIHRDIKTDFRERIRDRLEKVYGGLDVEVCYAFQSPTAFPEGLTCPRDASSPGARDNVLTAKGLLRGPFAVVNADNH